MVSADLSPGFKLIASAQAAYAEEQPVFLIKLPAAAQFPTRISAEDVAALRHWPELYPESFAKAFREKGSAALKSFLRSCKLELQQIDLIICPRLYKGMHQDLADALSWPLELFADSFEQHGLSGAASLPIALDALQPRLKGGKVLCVTFSSGLNWAFALLEPHILGPS